MIANVAFGFIILVMVVASLMMASVNQWGSSVVLIVLSLLLTVLLTLATYTDINNRYKDGQVDAILGKVYYEKVTHDDETVTWEWIEKEED